MQSTNRHHNVTSPFVTLNGFGSSTMDMKLDRENRPSEATEESAKRDRRLWIVAAVNDISKLLSYTPLKAPVGIARTFLSGFVLGCTAIPNSTHNLRKVEMMHAAIGAQMIRGVMELTRYEDYIIYGDALFVAIAIFDKIHVSIAAQQN